MDGKKDMPSVYIETYGCQMNVLDSSLIRDQLESLGYRQAEDIDSADVVLLNTCAVRDLSEHKVWSQLGRLAIDKKTKQPQKVIGVIGCMAERVGKQIGHKSPLVNLVVGPSLLDQIPALLEAAQNNFTTTHYALAGHKSRRSSTQEAADEGLETLDRSRAFSAVPSSRQAYVRITRGCNKFCSYCVVPFTRGPEIHRSPDDIVDEIRRLVSEGTIEVTLLGQTVNHYEFTDGEKTTTFAELLRRVHDEIPELPRLRFLTSFPRDFTDEALDVMAASPRICRYLHIPVQSGSNTMLKAMNRGHTIEDYLDLLKRARSRMPDIRLAGDMIVGFSGETEEDHQASIKLLKEARYKGAFIFKYSPREGTTAYKRLEDDVPNDVKKRRNLELLEIQSKIGLENHEALVGQELDVLVETQSKLKIHSESGESKNANPEEIVRLMSRSMGDEIVAFDGPVKLIGTITRVRVTKATALTVAGEWVENL